MYTGEHSKYAKAQEGSTSFVGHGAFPRDTIERMILPGNGDASTSDIPTFNLADTKWRTECMSEASIPAGYTYLAQLMGHDLGNNVPLSAVPYTEPNRTRATVTYGTYNLNENPLTLETIYAKGPFGTSHLYEPKRLMFRIAAGRTLSENIALPTESDTADAKIRQQRLLADQRNLDTIMLHHLAVVWMQYHNLVARTLIAQDYTDESNLDRQYYLRIYTETRAIVLSTWHTIVFGDLLPVFCHPKVLALSDSDIERTYLLSDVDTLHGIMRAFHALPLAKYRLEEGQMHSLMDILNPANEAKWGINWHFFFGPDAANKTALSASYSPQFVGKSGKAIVLADLISAGSMGALHGFSQEIKNAQNNLPKALQNDLSAVHLADLINKAAGNGSEGVVTEAEISKIPLFLLLMIEAQFYGENGGFGPFGSALLRRYLQHTKSQINYIKPSRSIAEHWPEPKTILDIINTVQNHTEMGS